MTRYTPLQRFPYPATRNEYGNGGAHLEALAQVADKAITRVAAAWTTLVRPGYAIYQLAADLNIPVANGLTDFTPPFPTFNTISTSSNVTSRFPFGGGSRPPAEYGWWDLSLHIASQPVGAANAGTRRYFQAQKLNQSNMAGNDVQIFVAEDTETASGGVTGHELNFPIYVDVHTAGVFIAYLHANTSSAVNILSAGTYLECVQLSGAIS